MTYQSHFYYNNDNYVQVDEDGNYTHLSNEQEATISGLQEFLVQKYLQGETHFALKLLTKPLAGNIFGEAVVQTINFSIELIDDDQNARITVGEGVDAVTTVVAATAIFTGIVAGLAATPTILASVLISVGASYAASFLVDLRDDAVETLVDSILDNTSVDVRFIDSANEHTEGVYFVDGLSPITPKLAVEYLISHSANDLSGGHVSFYIQDDILVGDQYNIFDNSALTKTAELLGIGLNDFLAAGIGSQHNNDNYAHNVNDDGFVYGIDGEEMTFFVPVTIDGLQSTIAVNNIFIASADGNLELAIGDGDDFFGGQTQLIIPESSAIITINGDDNDSNLILSDETGQIIYGGSNDDTIFGFGGTDILIGNGGDDILIGGTGTDTFAISTSDSGATTIIDDGGALVINGVALDTTAALDESDDNLWTLGGYTLSRTTNGVATQNGTDLTMVLDGDSSVVLTDFTSGAYGITLGDALTEVEGSANPLTASSDYYYTVYTPTTGEYVTEGYYSELEEYHEGYDLQGVTRVLPNDVSVQLARPEDIEGTSGNDTLNISSYAANGALNIHTYAGTDTISSHADRVAAQFVYAGDDRDYITTAGGLGAVYGEAGNDSFNLLNNSSATLAALTEVYGGSGRDTFTGTHAAVVDGGSGIDTWDVNASGVSSDAVTANFTTGSLSIAGNSIAFSGIEVLHTGAGDDSITGGAGNDSIYAGAGSNTIYGGGGDDVLQTTFLSSDGYSYLDGGDGNDALSASDTGGHHTVIGGAGNDSIYAGGDQNQLDGGNDNDSINVAGANNTISGGAGNDVIISDGADALIDGGSGFDEISLKLGFDGTTVTGGEAIRINSSTIGGAAQYDALAGTIGMHGTQISVESGGLRLSDGTNAALISDWTSSNHYGIFMPAVGTSGANSLSGTANAEYMYGLAGNDTIFASGGNDTIAGGDGFDTLNYSAITTGGVSYDAFLNTLSVDGQTDFLSGIEGLIATNQAESISTGGVLTYVSALGGNDSIDGAWLNETLDGGSGDNTIAGNGGDDAITASSDHDLIWGGDGNDTIDAGSGNNIIYGNLSYSGTDGNNIITSGSGADLIVTLNGADIITSGSGNDTILAGDGNDTISAGDGNDAISAGDGNDEIYGYELGADNIQGGAGDDYIEGALGNDYINGGDGEDFIDGASGNDTIDGGNGDDEIYIVESGTVFGGAGNDLIWAFGGHDLLYGDAGNDSIRGGSGNDTIDGGEGNDTIRGEAGNNNLTGGLGNDYIVGGTGNDYIDGGEGNDIIFGTIGNDTIFGGLGDDQLHASEGNTGVLLGGDGNDTVTGNYIALYGNDGDDYMGGSEGTIDGGAGNDTIEGTSYDIYGGTGSDQFVIFPWADATTVIRDFEVANPDERIDLTYFNLADFASLTVTNDGNGNAVITLPNNQHLILTGVDAARLSALNFVGLTSTGALTYGTTGNDTLSGSHGVDDLIAAGAGDDSVSGGTGNDYITGGDGNDTLNGYFDNDTLFGGNGDDSLVGSDGDDMLYGDDGADSLWGGNGADTIFGGGGNDLVQAQNGNDVIYTGVGDDTIYAGNDADTIDGGDGNDSIRAGSGDDLIYGGEGNDWIMGEAGADTIHAGGGDDWVQAGTLAGTVVYGDAGNDTVVGAGADDTLYGGDGDDSITGGGGVNILYGDAGNDTLSGGTGNDTLYGGADNDSISSGTGNDWADGGTGNDTINGYIGNDTLYGGADNDSLLGGDDADTLYGDAGADILRGDKGNDLLVGGEADDTFYMSAYDIGGAYTGNNDTIGDLRLTNAPDSNLAGGDSIELGAFRSSFNTAWNNTDAGANAGINTFAEYENVASAEDLYSLINFMTGVDGMRVLIDTANDTLIFDFDDELDASSNALSLAQDMLEGHVLNVQGWGDAIADLLGGYSGSNLTQLDTNTFQIVGAITNNGAVYDYFGKTYNDQLFA